MRALLPCGRLPEKIVREGLDTMISWICFDWNLAGEEVPVLPAPPLTLRSCDRGDREVVLKVLLDSFAMDTAWGDVARRIEEAMEDCVKQAFDSPEPSCVVAQHGQRVVGASLLDARSDAPNHLLSGPMILHEYRNRGVGSALLAASLRFLQSRGLNLARGVTRPGSTVARFVYPKFGGVQSPFTGDPFETGRG